jgi:hypothetical protein
VINWAARRRGLSVILAGNWCSRLLSPALVGVNVTRHPSDLAATVSSQTSQYSTMPVPRRGFNRASEIGTESSKWEFYCIVHGVLAPVLAKLDTQS